MQTLKERPFRLSKIEKYSKFKKNITNDDLNLLKKIITINHTRPLEKIKKGLANNLGHVVRDFYSGKVRKGRQNNNRGLRKELSKLSKKEKAETAKNIKLDIDHLIKIILLDENREPINIKEQINKIINRISKPINTTKSLKKAADNDQFQEKSQQTDVEQNVSNIVNQLINEEPLSLTHNQQSIELDSLRKNNIQANKDLEITRKQLTKHIRQKEIGNYQKLITNSKQAQSKLKSNKYPDKTQLNKLYGHEKNQQDYEEHIKRLQKQMENSDKEENNSIEEEKYEGEGVAATKSFKMDYDIEGCNGLSNHEIQDIMINEPDFIGVCTYDEIEEMVDKIKKLKLNEFSFIVNTKSSQEFEDNQNLMGHWIAVWFNADLGDLCIFDPLAINKEEVINEIKTHFEKYFDKEYDHMIKFKINNLQEQASDSFMCGWYCIRAIHMLDQGLPWSWVTGFDNISQNEEDIETFEETYEKYGYI